MDTECPVEYVEEAQKHVSADSLHTDFFPYNISKDPKNYDHAFDKRSHLLREQLEAKLQEPVVEGYVSLHIYKMKMLKNFLFLQSLLLIQELIIRASIKSV